MKRPEMLLWLSDARGVYIPRDFANSFSDRASAVQGVSDRDWAILELGPYGEDGSEPQDNNDCYWDTWNDVCDRAVVTEVDGTRYTIWQNGDCWLVPTGMEWNEEIDGFDWPDERKTEEEVDD